MPRRTWSDAVVAKLKPSDKVYLEADPGLPGHYVRVQPGGAKSFVAMARDPRGKQRWITVSPTALLGLNEARDRAREIINAVKAGNDHAPATSFESGAEQWFQRHVLKRGVRSAKNIRSQLDTQIIPAWGGRDLTSITRADVAKLLDTIEDKRGPVAADNALTTISSIFTWHEARDDTFTSPVTKKMRRTSIKGRARERILSDDDLRAVWKQAEANGTFGALIRILLLTGQRREKVAAMRWQDVSVDGAWSIPTEDREKGNARELELPAAAVEIIKRQPRFADNPYVFAGRGGSYATGYSKSKTAFDAKLEGAGKHIEPWTLHDLRRTARSIMSRAGVRPDIAERVLGHAINGVEGTYDRHSYREEKAHALAALASLIENILTPPNKKVVRLAR